MNAARITRGADRVWNVSGALTLESAPAVLDESGAIFTDGTEQVLDLKEVTDFDSAALALVIEWLRQARTHGARLRLRNVPQELNAVADVCGVSALLEATESPA